jgi:hypothetical protein
MTIFEIVTAIIVTVWFALTLLLWASFKEDERPHPSYRSMRRNEAGASKRRD